MGKLISLMGHSALMVNLREEFKIKHLYLTLHIYICAVQLNSFFTYGFVSMLTMCVCISLFRTTLLLLDQVWLDLVLSQVWSSYIVIVWLV